MAKKEICPKCSGQKYAKATDGSDKRYCASCHHVWIPGLEAAMTRPEFLLKREQELNRKLVEEITKLRIKVKQYEDAIGPEAASDEDELFD